MPDRILRSGILTSDAMNKLTFPAEVFYRRLMSVADDYGRFDGRTVVLRASLYPLLLDRVRDSDIHAWIGECLEAELVRLYKCGSGKVHIEIVKFGQRTQAKSKWPDPVDYQDLRKSTVNNGGSPPYSGSESGSESESIPPKPPGQKTERESLRLRLGRWFNRRETTAWSEKEMKAFAKLNPEPGDLDLLEWFFAFPMPKEVPYAQRTPLHNRRHDLLTLLNNWPGEVDKAKRHKHLSSSSFEFDDLSKKTIPQ